ncbi:hypothetical protein [uncultured Chitinophaga sp.]|uniref:hypothetical protein n=1 Tax=uncultured Chitinophaga sp. TaxID=339340 RepID=UPI0025D11EAA|nr:hypothetical protein [uncultured Chitinophaga sp.]
MKTRFYIQLSIKTAEGLESYGRFHIGDKRAAAVNLFGQLKGNSVIGDANYLFMELMETVDGLPFNLQLISCTLDEVAYNCRLISKEVFQLANLKS